jgi:23S rRNA pseudouridine2605 synthase
VASRREAERLIADGRVSVDGVVLDTPAVKVTPDQDIRVDGERIAKAEAPRLFRYHKPDGLLVTDSDPEGRPTIYERLPPNLPRLISIGRLDLNSEGLLLLTNDGGLARTLELPSTGWRRRYRVRAYGKADQKQLDHLKKGVVVDGQKFGPIEARIERVQGDNLWLQVTLAEGKKREVRRALETVGLKVNRLIRTAYGPFQLGSLKRGEVAEVPPKIMREQLGRLLG